MLFTEYLISTTESNMTAKKEIIISNINDLASYLSSGSYFYDDNNTSGRKNSLVLYRNKKYSNMSLSTIFGMVLADKKHKRSVYDIDPTNTNKTQDITKDGLKIIIPTPADPTIAKLFEDIKIKTFILKNAFRGVEGDSFAFFNPKFVKIKFDVNLKKPTTEKSITGDISVLFKINNYIRNGDNMEISLDEFVGDIDFTKFLINDEDAMEIDEFTLETTSAVLFFSDAAVGTVRIMDAYQFAEVTQELGYYTNNRQVFDLKMKKFEGSQIEKQDFYFYEIIMKTVVKIHENELNRPEKAIVSGKSDCIINSFNGVNILGGFGIQNKKQLYFDLYFERVSGSGEFFMKFTDLYDFKIDYSLDYGQVNHYYKIYSSLNVKADGGYKVEFDKTKAKDQSYDSFKVCRVDSDGYPYGSLFYEIYIDLNNVNDCYYYIDEEKKDVKGVVLWSRPLDIKIYATSKSSTPGLKDTSFILDSVTVSDEEVPKILNIFRPFIKYGGSILVDETPKKKSISEIQKYISVDSESSVSINFNYANASDGLADKTLKMEDRIGFLYPASYTEITEDEIETINGVTVDTLSEYCFGSWNELTKERVLLLKQQFLYNFAHAKQICADIISIIIGNSQREFDYTVNSVNNKLKELFYKNYNPYAASSGMQDYNVVNESDDESVIDAGLDQFMSSLSYRTLFKTMVDTKRLFDSSGSIFKANIQEKIYTDPTSGNIIKVPGYDFNKDALQIDVDGGDVIGTKMLERMKNYSYFSNNGGILKIEPYFVVDKLNTYIMKKRIDTPGAAETYYFDEPAIKTSVSTYQTKVDAVLRFFSPLKNENYISKYTGFLVTNFAHQLKDMLAGNIYNMFNLKTTEYGRDPAELPPEPKTNWDNIEENAKSISYRTAMRISFFDANINMMSIPISFLECYLDDGTSIDGKAPIKSSDFNEIGDITLRIKNEIDRQDVYVGEW